MNDAARGDDPPPCNNYNTKYTNCTDTFGLVNAMQLSLWALGEFVRILLQIGIVCRSLIEVFPTLFPSTVTALSVSSTTNASVDLPWVFLSCLVSQYIPDVSRSVFGLLAAMQKRARESEEGRVGDAGAGSKSKSKKAKGAGSGSVGGTGVSASPKVLRHEAQLLYDIVRAEQNSSNNRSVHDP